jgi:CIC family chloride channel protein
VDGRTNSGLLRRVLDGPGGVAVLAVVVGLAAGAGAVIFRWLLELCTTGFTGVSDYSAVAGSPNPWLPAAGRWFVIFVPVVGGLLYGPLVQWLAPEARGTGVPQVMAAVDVGGSVIRPRIVAVKALVSALCLGSGGSLGREGPIAHIGSALGSALGRSLRLNEADLRLLVCCGAAGGISATFNAPIGGVLFALELVLREFTPRAFGVVGLASVAADLIGRLAFGGGPFLVLPAFGPPELLAYPLFAVLGVLAGAVAVVFVRVFEGAGIVGDALWADLPAWLRPAAGGLLLGLLIAAVPQLYGVGYPPLGRAEAGAYALGFLLLLAAGKIAATSLSIAIGGSGGIFAPTLFVGSMLGVAFGMVTAAVLPGSIGPAGEYGLVGMGAVFGAAARAPMTAVVIMFELTGNYDSILPLLVAVALATGVAALVEPDTIYTLSLKKRGVAPRELPGERIGAAVRDRLRSAASRLAGR